MYLVVFKEEKKGKSEIKDFVFCLFLYTKRLFWIDFIIYLFRFFTYNC